MGVALTAPASTRCEVAAHRLAGLFVAVALLFVSPGSAMAGFEDGSAAYKSGDYYTSFREFMPLAVAGDSRAQVAVGLMYASGEGVPQDDAEALRWFRLVRRPGQRGRAMDARRDICRRTRTASGLCDGLHVAQSGRGELRGNTTKDIVAWRDKIAARLSRAERARGQELAHNWRPPSTAGSEGATPNPFKAELDRRARRDREVQQLLADLGYDPGPSDGVVGPKTRAAIRAFQADVGPPVDGQSSDALHTALADAVSSGQNVAARSAPTPPRLDATGTGFAVSQNGQLATQSSRRGWLRRGAGSGTRSGNSVGRGRGPRSRE